MLQKDLLLEHLKVIDNVSLPLRLKGVSRRDARAQADPLFEEFGLQGTQELYPAAMSGGMRQRAALLRTYLGSQGVALLDEPFSALDTITKGQIHTWYLDIMEKIDLSTIFITHDIDEAILLSNRIYIMTGAPGQIRDEIVIDRPRNDRKDFNLTQEFLSYKKDILKRLGR
jgi:ABC-type nitrate/sulfonate/bicarbonate transport system ATPase subunit